MHTWKWNSEVQFSIDRKQDLRINLPALRPSWCPPCNCSETRGAGPMFLQDLLQLLLRPLSLLLPEHREHRFQGSDSIRERGHTDMSGQKHPWCYITDWADEITSSMLWRSEFQRPPWAGGKLGSEELVLKGRNLHPSAGKGNVPHHRGSCRCFESNQERHEQTRTFHLPSSSPLLHVN